MSFSEWRGLNKEGKPPSGTTDEENVDELNDETFGEDITTDWESHHFSSILQSEEQARGLGEDLVVEKQLPTREDISSNGSRDGNISHFERLGLKDIWESSTADTQTSTLDSIWSPSSLPPPLIDKSPIHSTSPAATSSARKKINIVNVQDLEKSMMDPSSSSPSSHSQSPPRSPPITNVLPPAFRNLHSSPSPSPPPPGMGPNMGLYSHPPPHKMMFPHTRPPPGFPLIRPHSPHQQQFLPPTMMPPAPYYARGPVAHRMPHPYLPPNVPLMGPPPRLIGGIPQRPPLLVHPSQMGPAVLSSPVRHEMHRGGSSTNRPSYHQYHHSGGSGSLSSSKLNEMLYDLKPDGSGFMTRKEKEWVIKVQLIQLHSSNPEIDDYYYQKFIQRRYKSDKEEGVVQSGNKLTPLTLPPPVADRKERTRSAFEGTLGKVSVGSAMAPRRTIDVSPSSVEVKADVGSSRKKQALITIEKMYGLLLDLEELHAAALLSQSGEEGNEDGQQERRQDLCQQLSSLISLPSSFSGDINDNTSFQQLMSYQKGKRLFRRLLQLLNQEQAKVAVAYFSKNLSPIIKKDLHDKVLSELLPALTAVINLCELFDVQVILKQLQSVLSSKYVNNEFFVKYVTVLVNKGHQLISTHVDPPNDWISLLSSMNSLLQKSKSKSETLNKLLATPT